MKEKERLIVSELLLVYCFFSSSYFLGGAFNFILFLNFT